MSNVFAAAGGSLQRARLFLAFAVVVTLTGCANFYVDGNTNDPAPAQFRRPAQAKPVQVLFEFQTKGAANARGTEMLKDDVIAAVEKTALFASVSEQPSADAAVLRITLDNVPLTGTADAVAKGFVSGFTFGLAGTQVSDGYVCTVKYLPAGQTSPALATARHAIHTVMGAGADPHGAVKADTIEAAVRTMTRQVVGTALANLSRVSPLE